MGRRPRFLTLFEFVWRTSFVDSIVGVLLNYVGMSFVSDFKYIIQAYSHVCSVAYEQMERSDYLFTIVIFCHVHKGIGTFLAYEGLERSLQDVCYSRYSFTLLTDRSDEVCTYYEVSLDGTLVALWYHDCNQLRMLPDHERIIFAALGLTEVQYRDFVGTEEARHAGLQVDNREEIPPPTVEVIEVDLPCE